MLYVCDLWAESKNSSNVVPHGTFFFEFKHYPTNEELHAALKTKLPKGKTVKLGTSNVIGGHHISAIQCGDFWVYPTNLRALPKVRNKEKYLKNGKE